MLGIFSDLWGNALPCLPQHGHRRCLVSVKGIAVVALPAKERMIGFGDNAVKRKYSMNYCVQRFNWTGAQR
jgi:hypothetical protein